MSVVDKIVSGITDKLLDSDEFKSKDLDLKFREAMVQEDNLEQPTITDLREQESAVENLGLSIDEVYKAVSIKRGEAIKTTPRISVIQEVLKLSDSMEGVSATVIEFKNDKIKREEREKKEDEERDEQLEALEKEDKEERRRAVARTESLGKLIRQHSTSSWFSKIKNKILPFLIGLGLFLAFKEKIIEIFAPVWEKVKTWAKNNYPQLYKAVKWTVKIGQAIWNALKWVWNSVLLPTWNKILVPLWTKYLKPAIDFIWNGVQSLWNWIKEFPQKVKSWLFGGSEEGTGGSISPTGGDQQNVVGGGSREESGEIKTDIEPAVVIAERTKSKQAQEYEAPVAATAEKNTGLTNDVNSIPVTEASADSLQFKEMPSFDVSEPKMETPEQEAEPFTPIPEMEVESPDKTNPVVVQNNQTSVSSVNYHVTVDVFNVQI